MERHLIALDMDGTLLNSRKTISFKTKHYLKKLSKQGHLVILASGRPSRALWNYYNELELKGPMVCYNGAYFFAPNDPNFKPHIFAFPKDVVKAIYEKINPYIKNCMCESDTDIWLDKKDLTLAHYFWYEGMNMHYGNLSETLNEDPMTMICQITDDFKEHANIDEVVSQYEHVKARYWTGMNYFELYYEGTSKGAAIERIANEYGIKKENIISFGDATNDIEMFAASGTSVWMCNGKDKTRYQTTLVTEKDNDHNGIYYTLKKLLKK